MKNRTLISLSALALVTLVSGCATTGGDGRVMELEKELQMKESALKNTREENDFLASSIESMKAKMDAQPSAIMSMAHTDSKGDLLPPNAKPGECYARVLIPATYQTTTKQVVKSEATEKVEVIPAKYDWVEQQVLVKEASEKATLVPARYEWTTEKVLVEEASEKLITSPAVYKTVSEQVLVRPAYTTWKKGRGPIEKVDNATGEIMCLVEMPAEEKTVNRQVEVQSARTEAAVIPAQYKQVKRQVMVEPPKMVKTTIPAEYKTIRVKKLVSGPNEKRIKIPAVYTTVTEQAQVSDSSLEWRSILCETNTTADVVRKIQSALDGKGYSPGKIDGILGQETMAAVKRYQSDNKLAMGQLTIETLRSLGAVR